MGRATRKTHPSMDAETQRSATTARAAQGCTQNGNLLERAPMMLCFAMQRESISDRVSKDKACVSDTRSR